MMYSGLKLLAVFSFLSLVSCDYNETLAKRLLYMSSPAYSSSGNQAACLSSIFNYNGSINANNSNYSILDSFQETCDDIGNICSGFIVEASVEKNLYYVFSGSHGKTQLLNAAYSALKPDTDFYGMGQVLSYFKNAHDVLWPHIQPSLMNPKYKYYKAVFTGHSFGGPLATLACAQCGKIGYCPPEYVELYTFGAPRVGSVKFAKSLNALIGENFRIVKGNDPMPQLPPCAKTGGLLSLFFDTCCSDTLLTNPYHPGTEIWYNNDMMWGAPSVACTESTAVQNCPFRMPFRNVFWPDYEKMAKDHLKYFDITVTEYGKTNCTDKTTTFWE